MADTIFGVEVGGTVTGNPLIPGGGPLGASLAMPEGPSDDLAVQARQCYEEAVSAELWTMFTTKSEEDRGFYVGEEYQWSRDGDKSDLDRLKAQKRAVISINHIQPVVDVMTGFERQNRTDGKAAPQGDEDAEAAQLMTWLLKFVQEQTCCQDHITGAFEDGVIEGMRVLEIGTDDTEHVDGEIYVSELRPGIERDIIWDPYWSDYDLSDPQNGARYIIKTKWAFVRDVIARHPKKEAEITQAINDLDLIMGIAEGQSNEHSPRDGYGSVRSHPVESYTAERRYYDPTKRRVLVMEFWYRHYTPRYLVIDKATGGHTECDSMAEAQRMVATDPKNLHARERSKRTVRMATILPATYHVLEDVDSPYDNDAANYPFVLFMAKRKGDHIYGVVRNLKDAQRVENKRLSQVLDILSKFANIRPMAPKGALVDPKTLDDPAATGTVWYDAEKGPPGWFVPPLAEISRVLVELAIQMKINIRESSGINAPLQGLKEEAGQSGIALARLQSQGQVIATLFFDNLRRTRKLVYQRLARRIQQTFTAEQVVRLTNDVGAPVLVRLNPVEWRGKKVTDLAEWKAFRAQQQAAGKDVLRDVGDLKYDIVISEAPSTPTARATALLSLLDIVDKLPMLAPALIDVIIELADIPDRARVLERVRRLIPPELGGPMPPSAGPGGPGGPAAPMSPIAPPSPVPPAAPAMAA